MHEIITCAHRILHHAMCQLEHPVIVRGFDVELEDDGHRLVFFAYLNDEDEVLVASLKLRDAIEPQDFVPMQWCFELARSFGGSEWLH